MNMVATKRLWIRRWIRLGDMFIRGFKTAFAIPMLIIALIWDNIGKVLLIGVFGPMLLFVVSAMYDAINGQKVASNERLAEAAKISWCVAEVMPRRQKLDKNGAPLTNNDVDRAIVDCEKAKQGAEQKAVLDRLAAEQVRIIQESAAKR